MIFPNTTFKDSELVALLKEGDQAAFTQLYLKYSGPMYVNMLKMVKDEQLSEELVAGPVFKDMAETFLFQ